MNALGLSQREWSNTYSELKINTDRAHDPVVEASTISLERFTTPSSPAFGPEFVVADALPDIVLISADRVRLYAHLRRLLHASANSFDGLFAAVPEDRVVIVPEPAQVLLIALRVLYGLPSLHLLPALEEVDRAIEALVKYGVDVRRLAAPPLPLCQLILSFAPSHPVETYCLAARYDLEEVAIASSSHLLTYDLFALPDALATKMGPTYCQRLADLQRLRRSAFREILDKPLEVHPPNPICGDHGRVQLEMVWKAAIAKAVWNGAFNSLAQTVFVTYEEERTTTLCPDCRAALEERIQGAAREWAAVKGVLT